jgi:hypothetical protein
MIASAALGLALSTSLGACTHPIADTPAPVVAIPIRDTPPAELTACPIAPIGFPADEESWAVLPPAIRDATIRLAAAYATTRDQLGRLIDWLAPGACAGVR